MPKYIKKLLVISNGFLNTKYDKHNGAINSIWTKTVVIQNNDIIISIIVTPKTNQNVKISG